MEEGKQEFIAITRFLDELDAEVVGRAAPVTEEEEKMLRTLSEGEADEKTKCELDVLLSTNSSAMEILVELMSEGETPLEA